jgi:hypothetical protein
LTASGFNVFGLDASIVDFKVNLTSFYVQKRLYPAKTKDKTFLKLPSKKPYFPSVYTVG